MVSVDTHSFQQHGSFISAHTVGYKAQGSVERAQQILKNKWMNKDRISTGLSCTLFTIPLRLANKLKFHTCGLSLSDFFGGYKLHTIGLWRLFLKVSDRLTN